MAPEDPVHLNSVNFHAEDQVSVVFEEIGGADPEYFTEWLSCSPSPSAEEYAEIVRKAAAAIHKRLVKSAAFLASKYNL